MMRVTSDNKYGYFTYMKAMQLSMRYFVHYKTSNIYYMLKPYFLV